MTDHLAQGSLSIEQTLQYGSEIADALDKAHRQGIVHRDLKPSNIGDDGRNPRVVRTAHRFGYAFSSEAWEERSSAGAPRARLLEGDQAYHLTTGENLIGREDDCRVVLDFPGVSRHHARILISDEAVLQDLGSKNGTWLNGRRIDAPVELHDRDKIRIGMVTVTFLWTQGKETTATVE